jgi:hypothetical protein
MKKNIELDNEEVSVILYALIATKQNVDASLLEQMDKLIDKIQQVKYTK